MSHIEYPSRYAAATKRNIIGNALKTFVKNNPDVTFWLTRSGQWHEEEQRYVYHPDTYWSDFRFAMVDVLNDYGKLSPKQILACEAIIAKSSERQAKWDADRLAETPTEIHPEGRQELAGTVVKISTKPDPYSYMGGLLYKMTVKTESGHLLHGAIPRKLNYEDGVEVGDIIAFTATVSNAKDFTMNWFKRPAKASITTKKVQDEQQ